MFQADAEIHLDGLQENQWELLPIIPKYYPDGMPLITDIDTQTLGTSMLLRPRGLLNLVSALFLVDALDDRGIGIRTLLLPCLPGARQDRLNDTGDMLFTAKSIAAMINARNFRRVICVDPHSDVMPALINNCKIAHPKKILDHLSLDMRYDIVIAPDAGAAKRASAIARHLGVPMVQAWKTRDVKDGSITGFGMESYEIEGCRALVIDDICDGGGTFLGLADILDANNVRADLFVTHGIFSRGTQDLLERYTSVITTDSFIGDHTGCTVIPVCEALL